MCGVCRLITLLFVPVFYFNSALGSQSNPEAALDPCDLMMRGEEIYGDSYPAANDFPLMNARVPVELHLNYTLPDQQRLAADRVISALNEKAGFKLLTISDEIDNSEWDDEEQQAQDSRNVIYWLNQDQYETRFIEDNPEILLTAAATVFQDTSFRLSVPRVLVYDTDVFMYGERNTVMGEVHWRLTQHLNRMGVEYPEDMDTAEMQNLFLRELSSMTSDAFYDMVIKLMEDKRVTLPDDEPENIKRWIIDAINAEMNTDQPLESFEDLRDLIIREYTLDLTTIAEDTASFEMFLTHEIGHVLGFNDTDRQNSFMHHGIHITPVPVFPRSLTIPKPIDDISLLGLECSYDLDLFKQYLPLEQKEAASLQNSTIPVNK